MNGLMDPLLITYYTPCTAQISMICVLIVGHRTINSNKDQRTCRRSNVSAGPQHDSKVGWFSDQSLVCSISTSPCYIGLNPGLQWWGLWASAHGAGVETSCHNRQHGYLRRWSSYSCSSTWPVNCTAQSCGLQPLTFSVGEHGTCKYGWIHCTDAVFE